MRSNYKRLGEYIRETNIRNNDLRVSKLLGVSNNKCFIPSIANIIGTDLSVYKILKKGQFAYGTVTSRNGDKVSIALLEDDECIISVSYTSFEVIDSDTLLPEYLMLWFLRPEFDRYARFKSHGSAREVFSWDELCDVMLPVPDIEKQKAIVAEYKTITNRIELNNKLIKTLDETAKTIYKNWFVDFEFPNENGQPYKSSGGEMQDSELGQIPEGWERLELERICNIKSGKRLPQGEEFAQCKSNHPYITIKEMTNNLIVARTKDIQYISEKTHKSISRYIVNTDDIILSIVGSIGIVSKVHKTLNTANLTENCVKLVDIKNEMSNSIFIYLRTEEGQRDIESKIVGGVQGKLPIYNISKIKIIYPMKTIAICFNSFVEPIFKSISCSFEENMHLSNVKDILLSKLSVEA